MVFHDTIPNISLTITLLEFTYGGIIEEFKKIYLRLFFNSYLALIIIEC